MLNHGSEVVAPFWLVLTLVYPVRSKRHTKFQVRLFNWVSIASWLMKCPTTVCVRWLVKPLSLYSCSNWVQIPFRSPWHHFDDDLVTIRHRTQDLIYRLVPELNFLCATLVLFIEGFFFL